MEPRGNQTTRIVVASLGVVLLIVIAVLTVAKDRAGAQGHADRNDQVDDDKRLENREVRAPANHSPAQQLVGRCVHAHTREAIPSVELIVNGAATVAAGTGFKVPRPASGHARLQIRARGFDDALVVWKPGMKHDLGDIVLLPSLALRGRVLTPTGEPAARARVVLLDRLDRDWTVLQTCETTVNGAFSLPLRRTTREWRVLASLAGVGVASVTLSEPPESVVIRLERGYAMKGVVRSARSGRPVEGVRVLLQIRGRPQLAPLAELTQTNEVGEFTVTHVDLTRTSLAFDKPGFALAVARAGTPTRLLEIELPEAREVAGQVIDVENKPVENALVRVGVSRGFFVQDVRSDATGRFVVARVPDIRRLHVSASRGLANGAAPLGPGSVTITVKPPAHMTEGVVTVVDRTGTNLPDMRVLFLRESGGAISQTTNSKGTAAFRFHRNSTVQGMLVATGHGLVGVVKEPITLPHWPDNLVLVVRRGVLLRGRVVLPPSARSGAVRLVARLTADFAAVVGRTWTSETGDFFMTVPVGQRLAIPVRVAGATPRLVLTDVDKTGTDLGDIVLRPGVTIRGSVSDEAGKTLGSVTVRCLKPGWSRYFNSFATITENDGSFKLIDVPPAPFVVHAISHTGAQVKQEHDGSVTDYELTLLQR